MSTLKWIFYRFMKLILSFALNASSYTTRFIQHNRIYDKITRINYIK